MLKYNDAGKSHPRFRLGIPVNQQHKYFGQPTIEPIDLYDKDQSLHSQNNLRLERASQRYDAYEKYKKRRNLANRIKKDRTRRKREKAATSLAKWYRTSASTRKANIHEILARKVPTIPRQQIVTYLNHRSIKGGRRKTRTRRRARKVMKTRRERR